MEHFLHVTCLICFGLSVIGNIFLKKEVNHILGWFCAFCWCLIAMSLKFG